MDQHELIKIGVTAVVSVTARELLTFAVKHSKVAAQRLKALAVSVLRRQWLLLPVLLHGSMFLFFGYVVLFLFAADDTVATHRFVAWFAFTCYTWISSGYFLRYSLSAYISHLRAPPPNHALQRTEAGVAVTTEIDA